MASGFKDWDVPVNINAQALGQIINRPKYGESLIASFADSITNIGSVTLLTVSGRGMIYGGLLTVNDPSSAHTSSFRVSLDGQLVYVRTIAQNKTLGFPGPFSDIVHCTQFDDISKQFTFAFSYGFTFETEFIIAFQSLTSEDVVMSGSCFFALV